MANKIEMSLDDIIKSNRVQNRKPQGGNRGGGAAGNRGYQGQGGRRVQTSPRKPGGAILKGRGSGGKRKAKFSRGDVNSARKHDMYDGPKRAILKTTDSAKLLISNLDYSVSDADIRELFTEFGPLNKAAVHYDSSGRSLGTADVVFQRRLDALKAIKQYNGVFLDGRKMNIQFLTDAGSITRPVCSVVPSPQKLRPQLKKVAVHYDRSERSLGTADVVFERRFDALKDIKKCNDVPLDGTPMTIQFLTDAGSKTRPVRTVVLRPQKRTPQLKKVAVHYDRSERSLGTADVVFERRFDALKDVKKYNSVPLNGTPMNKQLLTDAGSITRSVRRAVPSPQKRIPQVKKLAVHYDRSERSLGTADVVFERRFDALKDIKKYNSVPLNGTPMNKQLLTDAGSITRPVRSVVLRPQKRTPQLKNVAVHYDRSERSLGTADVVFERRFDALKDTKKYNSVPLNGRKMNKQLLTDAGSITRPLCSAVPSSQKRRLQVGGGAGGGNRRGGAAGGNRRGGPPKRNRPAGGAAAGGRTSKKTTPTAEELDAELDAYVNDIKNFDK